MPPAPVMFCGTTLGLPGMCLPRWRATSRACKSYSPPTPTPISSNVYLAECGRLIEENPEMSRPMDEAGQIDLVLRPIGPGDMECPWRACGADGFDARECVRSLLLT